MTTTNNAQNVSAGKPNIAGSIYIAPINTALPTDAETALPAAFKSLGYVGEDGLANNNSPESDSKKAWGGDTVLAYQTGKEDTFRFTLLETLKEEVNKFVYGDDNVTPASTSAPLTVKANAKEAIAHAFAVDMIASNGEPLRICIPSAKLTELGEINYTDEDAIGYDCTITCTPDTNGNTHYKYIGKKNK